MKRIFKYELENLNVYGRTMVAIPKDYRILDLQKQGMNPVIWAEVDPSSPKMFLEFLKMNTGGKAPESDTWAYLRTYQEGMFVWHIYYREATNV